MGSPSQPFCPEGRHGLTAVASGFAWVALVATMASVGIVRMASTAELSTAVTRGAAADDDVRPDHFSFSAGGFQYSLTARGLGHRSTPGRAPQRFQLRIDPGAWMERVWYLAVGRDIILVHEDADGEDGWGAVVRLTGERLRVRWSARIPGFNIGEAVIEGDDLYVTAIGFVGKLNVTSGRYAWAHKDLYRDGRFNSFKRPVVRDAWVTFTDGSNVITVEKRSGALAR